METTELQALLNRLKDVREHANWGGKFTAEVRELTREFRYTKIAEPLNEVISKLEAELKRRGRRRRNRKQSSCAYRAPYSEN